MGTKNGKKFKNQSVLCGKGTQFTTQAFNSPSNPKLLTDTSSHYFSPKSFKSGDQAHKGSNEQSKVIEFYAKKQSKAQQNIDSQ